MPTSRVAFFSGAQVESQVWPAREWPFGLKTPAFIGLAFQFGPNNNESTVEKVKSFLKVRHVLQGFLVSG